MIFVLFSIKLQFFKNKFSIEQRRHSKHISDGEFICDKISCLRSCFYNFLALLHNPNPHTIPCIPNRYGIRGACAWLASSPTPSTSRSISHWWARWVSVACLGQVLRGGRAGRGVGAGRGGGRERRKCASHPVNRAYTHQILQFSYFLLSNEPIRGSHFSSFLHILSLKQYNGWISM